MLRPVDNRYFTPARTPSRVDAAYDALKSAIRDNVFSPGHQGSEQEIALRLGMSRTPVHEALIRLQEEGLVRVLPKRGIIVLPLSPDDMREIYDVIIALEGAAAERLAASAKSARTHMAGLLTEINADMLAALTRDDRERWAQADDRFHRTLIDHCGNGRLTRMMHSIMDQSHRARMMTLRLRAKPVHSTKDHQAIIAAIRAGNIDQAVAVTRKHRQRARDELLPLMTRLGMQYL